MVDIFMDEQSAAPLEEEQSTESSTFDDSSSQSGYTHSEVHTQGKVLFRTNPRNSITIFTGISMPHYRDEDADNVHGRTHHGMYEMEWCGIIFTHPPVRKLINQSHAFFTELQDTRAEPEQCVKYSRLYRVALQECVMGLQKEGESDGLPEEEREQIYEQIEFYSQTGLLWHLCEILFVETLPVGCLIQQLLEWVRWHDRQIDNDLREVMGVSPPEGHDKYWTTIYGLTLQGRVDEVKQLLSHFSYCQQNRPVFESIDELLRKVPMIKSVIGHSRTELRGIWYIWRQECRRRRERQDFIGCRQLDLLCGILCGDEACFREPIVIDSCRVWYTMLVGRLLYCSPLVLNTDYELHYIATNCFEQYCGPDYVTSFDQLLLDAFQNKVIDVIKQGSAKFSNWWFVSHMANLLHHRGVLVTSQLEYGSELNEFLLIEYATSLFVHPSLWEIAISYLSYCPTQGRHFMCSLIERVPLTTSTKALKLIRVCRRYNMVEQAQSICRVLARRCYDRGSMGSALSWCIRGHDTTFAAFLAEKYFDTYEDIGEFCDLSILDYLGDAVLLSNRLAFLSKYRQFHKLYTSGEFVSAGQILVHLLTSGATFKRYWLTLLTDALPLLELSDICVFNSQDTLKLIHAVQEIEDRTSTVDQDLITSQEDHDNKLTLFRLALVKNLHFSLQTQVQ